MASLADYAKQNPEFVAKYYARLAKTDEDGITALNTMLAQDGLLVYVKKNVVVDKTVQVINILRSAVDLMVNRRVLIVMEEGANAINSLVDRDLKLSISTIEIHHELLNEKH